MRRPTARLPFIVLVSAALAGAALADDTAGSPAIEPRSEPPTVAFGAAGSEVLAPTAPARGASGATYYCAAGTGRDGMAEHAVAIVNIDDHPVTATVRVHPGALDGGESPASESGRGGTADLGAEPVAADPLVVSPGERTVVPLTDIVDAPLLAASVEVDGGAAIVEHEVSGPHGRGAGPCATAAASEWHVAWGATTRGAHDNLVLFNPFLSPASVDVALQTEDGRREPVRFQGLPVPAQGVLALDIGSEVTRHEVIAATVHAHRGQVVVERLQSFDGSEGPPGLSVALAAPEPSTGWAFAADRVTAAGAPTVAVYNPGDERAEVDVSVLPDSGDMSRPAVAPQPFGLSIAAGDVKLVRLGDEERVPVGVDLAIVVNSTNGVPVVVERVVRTAAEAIDDPEADDAPMRQDPLVGELTAGLGAPVAGLEWWFGLAPADGRTSSQIVVVNPDPVRPVRVALHAARQDGVGDRQHLLSDVVAAGGRRTLDLASTAPEHGAVLVLQAEAPVVAEQTLADGAVLAVASPGLPRLDDVTAVRDLIDDVAPPSLP